MFDCRIITAQDLVLPQPDTASFGQLCAFTAKAQNKAGPNEDSMALITVSETQAVIAVADGLGGHAQGQEASRIAVETLCKALRKKSRTRMSLRNRILDGIELANRKILALKSGAATTLVIAEIDGSKVRIYQVGDSAALLTGQRGNLKYRTIAHSPVGHAQEAELLSEAEAMQADNRHIVANTVGSKDMRIEIGPVIRMARYDTLLLASDGLTDNVMTHDLVEMIRTGPIGDACDRVYQAAVNAMALPTGHIDDLSVAAFRRP